MSSVGTNGLKSEVRKLCKIDWYSFCFGVFNGFVEECRINTGHSFHTKYQATFFANMLIPHPELYWSNRYGTSRAGDRALSWADRAKQRQRCIAGIRPGDIPTGAWRRLIVNKHNTSLDNSLPVWSKLTFAGSQACFIPCGYLRGPYCMSARPLVMLNYSYHNYLCWLQQKNY